ncbi:MAG: exodeoxyribonuclease V subunit gamma [Candidatus Riflebacteria bacterium]|nr:exodeoxyribonuclease V subunit gamma [Candidatus Riflebacteria bacterium]
MALLVQNAARLDSLVGLLEKAVREILPGRDLLAPLRVLVPHSLVGAWLQLALVNAFGGRLEVAPVDPERGLWDCLPPHDGTALPPLTAGDTRDLILGLLLGPDAEARSSLGPLWEYLAAGGTAAGALVSLLDGEEKPFGRGKETPGPREGSLGHGEEKPLRRPREDLGPAAESLGDEEEKPLRRSREDSGPAAGNLGGGDELPRGRPRGASGSKQGSFRDGDDADPSNWRRAWQLADTLARLFHEYESLLPLGDGEEPGILPLPSLAAAHPHHAWQTTLYNQLFRAGGWRDRLLPGRFTLRQAALRSSASPASIRAAGPEVWAFGFTAIRPLLGDVLARLGQHRDARLFLLTPGSHRAPGPAQPGGALPAGLWNAAAQSTIRDLLARTGGPSPQVVWKNPRGRRPHRADDSFLHAAQNALAGDPPSTRRPQDPTLQIRSCPGPRPEVDLVARLLLDRLAQGPCPFNDIGFLVTDPARQVPGLAEACQRLGIPFQVVGGPSGSSGSYGPAVTALFDLAAEGFSRRAVFEVLHNPCWQAAAGATPDMVRAWLGWAQTLGIFHGFDRDEKSRLCRREQDGPCDACRTPTAGEAGFAPTDRHTWRQALRRLRLGRLMEMRPWQPADPLAAVFAGCVPYTDQVATDEPCLTSFSVGLETLAAQVARLADRPPEGSPCPLPRSPGSRRSCLEWSGILAEAFDALLRPRPDQAGEILQRSAVFGALDHLRALDPFFPDGLPFGLVREFVLGAAASGNQGNPGGRPFFAGVTIAPLAAAAAIPFAETVIVGLGEEQFPGTTGWSSLDLLAGRPGHPPGHPFQPADLHRLAFLTALQAARERLVLTFSHLDPAREAEANPAVALIQFREFLEGRVLPAGSLFQVADSRREPGLDRPFPCPGPADRHEWLVRQVLRRRFVPPDATTADRIDRALADFQRGGLDPRALAPSPGQPGKEGLRMGVRHLAAFLRDPASAFIDWLVRASDDDADEETADRRGAPVRSDWLETRGVLTRAVTRFLGEGDRLPPDLRSDPSAYAAALYEWEQHQSHMPDGVWGVLDRAAFTRDFTALVEACQGLLGEPGEGPRWETLILGSGSRIPRGRQVPPLPLAVRPATAQAPAVEVAIHGRFHLARVTDEAIHVPVFIWRAKPDRHLDKALLQPILTYLAFLAREAGERPDGEFTVGGRKLVVHLCSPEGVTAFASAWTPVAARSHLEMLAADFLAQDRFEDLRLEVAQKVAWPPPSSGTAAEGSGAAPSAARTPAGFVEAWEAFLDRDRGGDGEIRFQSDLFESLPDPGVPADALEKIRRRLVPLFPQPLADLADQGGPGQEESDA